MNSPGPTPPTTTATTTVILRNSFRYEGVPFSDLPLQIDLDAPFLTLLTAAAEKTRFRIEDIRLICMGRDCPSYGCDEASTYPIRHPSFSDRSMAVTEGTVFHLVLRGRLSNQ